MTDKATHKQGDEMSQEKRRQINPNQGGRMKQNSERHKTATSLHSRDIDCSRMSINRRERKTNRRSRLNEKQRIQPCLLSYDIIAINKLSRSES